MAKQMIIRALERQVELYRRLVQLSAKQRFHVNNGQTDRLLDLLDDRKEVLREIGQLEEQIRPLMKSWKHFIKTLGADEKSNVQELIGRVRDLLEQITQSDRNDANVLAQRRVTLGRQVFAARAIQPKLPVTTYSKTA